MRNYKINLIELFNHITLSYYATSLSSLLPLRSAGRSNFDKGFHNLITLIEKNGMETIIINEVAILQNGINRGQL